MNCGFEPIVHIIHSDLTKERAWQLEIEYIKIIGRRITNEGPLTNVMPGGNCFPDSNYDYTHRIHPLLGKKRSEETCKAISVGKLGKSQTEEHVKNHANAIRGTHHTEETKQKISKGNKGKQLSQETLDKMKLAQQQRKPVSKETREKMSNSAKNRKNGKN